MLLQNILIINIAKLLLNKVITKAEWVMMEDKTTDLEQAFKSLQAKATNITGNSFVAKKNGRYLIKITDEKQATLYSFIDVTGIVPMSSLYEQYLKEEFSEEEQMPFIRLEPDIETKSTLVTIRDNYDSSLWVIKKQDFEEQGSVWETIALEKMVSKLPALVSDQGNYTVTLTENTDYWVLLQDKNGNFDLKPFSLKMAYDMNLKATIAERNEDQPLAVTITADQALSELKVLYAKRQMLTPLEDTTIPWNFYLNEWEYYQKYSQEAILLEGNTFEITTIGDYCIYAKNELGYEMITKIEAKDIKKPRIELSKIIWFDESEAEMFFSVTPNPNTELVKMGWMHVGEEALGDYDHNYNTQWLQLLNQSQEIELTKSNFLWKAPQNPTQNNKNVQIIVADTFGNANRLLIEMDQKPASFLELSKQGTGVSTTLSIANKEEFKKITWLRFDGILKNEQGLEKFLELQEQFQEMGDGVITASTPGSYVFYAIDQKGAEHIKVVVCNLQSDVQN